VRIGKGWRRRGDGVVTGEVGELERMRGEVGGVVVEGER
jgi:hypothetical protein